MAPIGLGHPLLPLACARLQGLQYEAVGPSGFIRTSHSCESSLGFGVFPGSPLSTRSDGDAFTGFFSLQHIRLIVPSPERHRQRRSYPPSGFGYPHGVFGSDPPCPTYFVRTALLGFSPSKYVIRTDRQRLTAPLARLPSARIARTVARPAYTLRLPGIDPGPDCRVLSVAFARNGTSSFPGVQAS